MTWEYPRETPDGEQMDIVEVMEIRDGLIAHHRVYWGWYSVGMLLPASIQRDGLSPNRELTMRAEHFDRPVAARFDPFDADYLADPYPTLAAVREQAPVFHSAELDMWVVTRSRDIEAIFADPAAFSAAITQDPLFPLAPEARAELGPDFPLPKTMSNCDPPEHARIRRFNLRAFSARRVKLLESRVCTAAKQMIHIMLERDRFDVVADLTYPLPA